MYIHICDDLKQFNMIDYMSHPKQLCVQKNSFGTILTTIVIFVRMIKNLVVNIVIFLQNPTNEIHSLDKCNKKNHSISKPQMLVNLQKGYKIICSRVLKKIKLNNDNN